MHIHIVGAGLAGLAAAIELEAQGHSVNVFESASQPGGRVASRIIDGHIVDAGFQILLTDYPEAKRLLDYDALELCNFTPGSMLYKNDKFHTIGDPFRNPKDLFKTLLAPVGSLRDKTKLLAMRRNILGASLDDLWVRDDLPTEKLFENYGFSDKIVTNFLQPLFAGITLDPTLQTSSRFTEFTFAMLAKGSSAVPAQGMGQIATQLSQKLSPETLKLGSEVAKVTSSALTFADGTTQKADATLVATDVSTASKLTDAKELPDLARWHATTSVWFSAPEPPFTKPYLLLNASGKAPINSVAIMSNISQRYAPTDKATIVASVPSSVEQAPTAITNQLVDWFGPQVEKWEVLDVQHIRKAHPLQKLGYKRPGYLHSNNGVWFCGDYLAEPSINGALRSGRIAAKKILNALSSLT